MSDLSLENHLRPKEGRYREILSDKEHDITNAKQEITKWLITIYNDAKEMGLELQSVDHYIEIARQALEANDWGKALTYANRSINTMVTLAETCSPELNLKKIKNVQLQSRKWSKLKLEVYNSGNSHAKDIEIRYQGDIKIKSPEKLAKLKVDETDIITLEIYPKKKGIFPLELELVCKKIFDNTEFRFEERLWVQVGDVQGNTKLKRRFGYHNGYIRMELTITNEDPMDIHDVILELIYDENLITLSHLKPVYTKLGKKLQIGHIEPSGNRNIVIYFDPLLCTDIFIGGGVSLKDWQGKEKYLILSPQKVKVLCPNLFTKESIGLGELKGLLQNELTFSGSKVIDIPLGLDIESTLTICKELIFRYNIKLVQEIIASNPARAEVWFYCTTEDRKYKFAIKLGIDEDTNSIELYVTSKNNAAITGLLTDLLANLNNDLQARGIIQNSLRQIENMALKENIILAKKCLLFEPLEKLERHSKIDYAQEIKDKCKPLIEKFEGISRRERFLIGHRRDGEVKLR